MNYHYKAFQVSGVSFSGNHYLKECISGLYSPCFKIFGLKFLECNFFYEGLICILPLWEQCVLLESLIGVEICLF